MISFVQYELSPLLRLEHTRGLGAEILENLPILDECSYTTNSGSTSNKIDLDRAI